MVYSYAGYCTSSDRKKRKRAIMKKVRAMNKNLEKDNLWQGRFEAQVRHISYFSDEGFLDLVLKIDFIDKKTGLRRTRVRTDHEWSIFYGNRLFEDMNDFIINDVKVWEEKPNPYEQDSSKWK